MKGPRAWNSPLVRQALAAAALMMAWQWAGKTTRDSLFLLEFSASALPAMMGGAAVCSLLTAALNAALMRRFGPGRVIPIGYAAGTALHLAEWALFPRLPHLVAIVVYLHVVALGSVLLSGFWALANERFDPREARRHFGQIAAFGTLGTLAGGVMSERVAALSSTQNLPLLLGALQLACAIALFRFAPRETPAPKRDAPPSFPEVISGAPYLMGLAGLVVLMAMSASTLDYLFKASAAGHYARGAALTRFFAIFNTATSLATFAIQMGANRRWLGRFGPGHTVAALPVAVTGASVVSIFVPGLAALTLSRAVEILLRGSLYRSGYELFYTPMPDAEKRSIKPVIDVGAERLGDGLAAAGVQLLLTLPAQAFTAILAFTAALAAAGVWVALRLDRVYIKVLERGLAHHSGNSADASSESTEDANDTISVVTSSSTDSGVAAFTRTNAPPPMPDPVLRTLAELRSQNASRIRAALDSPEALDPVATPQLIQLLDRDDVAQSAFAVLCRCGERATGQLVDALGDPANSFNIRKRIPKVLSAFRNRAAWDGLAAHLLDRRFEVRTRCARALARIAARDTGFELDQNLLFDAVRRELAGKRKLTSETNAGADGLRAAMKERETRTVSHIFTLLALALPGRPVQTAFRALQADGAWVKGVALEYLDSTLPEDLRRELTAYFEGSVVPRGGATKE